MDVPVVPIDDATLEGNETVVLTLRTGPGYVLAPPTVGTVTIVSDDVAPDLTVTVLTGPGLAGAGLTLDVTDTTRNQGTGPSGESTTSFYLSPNTFLDANDPLVGTRPVPGLLPGTNDTITSTLTVPAGTATGTYWIIGKADGPGTVGESNETNNTRMLLVRVGPDLAVTALTAPAVAGPGASVSVNDTTKNQGGGNAAASSTRFYLSANFTLDAGDAALESHGVGALTVGASTTTTTTLTIPTTVASGTFYLFAVADDGNALAESTENNNTRFVTIRIGADLFVSALTAPTRVGSGSTISVTDTIRNSGGGGSGPSTTAFYLSANLTFDAGDARLSGTRSVGPLDAGASSMGTTGVTLPAVTPGTWYLIAAADDTGEVSETQETNNVRLTTIYVGPDLLAAGVNAPFTVTAGSTVTVTDSVRNIGADVAAASTTRFYLSLNGTLDAADILLDGERAVAAIAVNGISTGPTTLMIPAGLSGRYTLLAIADALGAVAESSEINNASLRSITINP